MKSASSPGRLSLSVGRPADQSAAGVSNMCVDDRPASTQSLDNPRAPCAFPFVASLGRGPLSSPPPRAQKLEASNVKPFDRFGSSASIEGNSLIVGSHQEYEQGTLAYQQAVQVVTVQCDPGGERVGGVYRLGWKETCVDDEDDVCEVRITSGGSRRAPCPEHTLRVVRSLARCLGDRDDLAAAGSPRLRACGLQ